jgi:hypothetical protein
MEIFSPTITGSLTITGSTIITGSITQGNYTASFGGNVGIGTTTPAYKLDVVGGVRAIKLHSSGSRPTVVAETNMGTGKTATIYGDNISGIITLNTGTGVPTGNQVMVTLTYSSAYTNNPIVVITPTAAPVTFTPYVSTTSTTSFTIGNCNGNVASSTTYYFNYHVIEANDTAPAP